MESYLHSLTCFVEYTETVVYYGVEFAANGTSNHKFTTKLQENHYIGKMEVVLKLKCVCSTLKEIAVEVFMVKHCDNCVKNHRNNILSTLLIAIPFFFPDLSVLDSFLML